MAPKTTLGPADLDAFTATITEVVAHAKSIGDIEQWLTAQPFVASVRVMDYLRKSESPQREILVDLTTTHAGIQSNSLTIFELGQSPVSSTAGVPAGKARVWQVHSFFAITDVWGSNPAVPTACPRGTSQSRPTLPGKPKTRPRAGFFVAAKVSFCLLHTRKRPLTKTVLKVGGSAQDAPTGPVRDHSALSHAVGSR